MPIVLSPFHVCPTKGNVRFRCFVQDLPGTKKSPPNRELSSLHGGALSGK
jgi:hypothetical protein